MPENKPKSNKLVSSHEKRVCPVPRIDFPPFRLLKIPQLSFPYHLSTKRPDIFQFAMFGSFRIAVASEGDISLRIITQTFDILSVECDAVDTMEHKMSFFYFGKHDIPFFECPCLRENTHIPFCLKKRSHTDPFKWYFRRLSLLHIFQNEWQEDFVFQLKYPFFVMSFFFSHSFRLA